MTAYLIDCPPIREGMRRLQKDYPHIAQLCDDPLTSIKRTKYDDPFHGLVKIVAGQQVSTKAAVSIWCKLEAHMCEGFTPAAIMQQNFDDLRGCGLSARKVEYIQGLATAVDSGELDLKALEALDDEAIAEQIISLKGFGRWSADMFLLFGLGRGNIWAIGDLGVRLGLQIFLGQDERPSDDQMRRYASVFAPHGSAASLLMWHIKAQN